MYVLHNTLLLTTSPTAVVVVNFTRLFNNSLLANIFELYLIIKHHHSILLTNNFIEDLHYGKSTQNKKMNE